VNSNFYASFSLLTYRDKGTISSQDNQKKMSQFANYLIG